MTETNISCFEKKINFYPINILNDQKQKINLCCDILNRVNRFKNNITFYEHFTLTNSFFGNIYKYVYLYL